MNFAIEAQPLRELLKKEKKWTWTAKEESSFNKVKDLFVESVQLQKPDYNRPFIIYTNGSYLGVGGVLLQENGSGEYRVIATTNRSLSKPELRLFPTEIEICAIYHALQKFCL